MGFQLPRRMVGRQLIRRPPPALADGRAGSHALQAVAVERAAPLVGVGRPVVRQGDVAELRVHQAVQQLAVDQPAAADARADGQVDEGIQPLRRAPAPLAQAGDVDVGVEADGRAQPPADGPGHVSAGPTGLGRAGNATEGRRRRVGVQRAEGGDADGGHRAIAPLLLAEEGQGTADGFVGRGCREACFGPHVVRPRAHGADELRPPRFNPAHICVVHAPTPSFKFRPRKKISRKDAKNAKRRKLLKLSVLCVFA